MLSRLHSAHPHKIHTGTPSPASLPHPTKARGERGSEGPCWSDELHLAQASQTACSLIFPSHARFAIHSLEALFAHHLAHHSHFPHHSSVTFCWLRHLTPDHNSCSLTYYQSRSPLVHCSPTVKVTTYYATLSIIITAITIHYPRLPSSTTSTITSTSTTSSFLWFRFSDCSV